MPLKINPVRVKHTYYLLVPKDLADMLDITSSDTFNLTMKKNTDTLTLTYKKEASKK